MVFFGTLKVFFGTDIVKLKKNKKKIKYFFLHNKTKKKFKAKIFFGFTSQF